MGTATLIDGRKLAQTLKDDLKARATQFKSDGGIIQLDAVMVGGDEGAGLYAKNQAKACHAIGIDYTLHELSEDVTQSQLLELIDSLNADPAITGIMVHMPLPASIDAAIVQSQIATAKDVEGVNPANIGNVVFGRRSLVPCTALAVLEMIESTGVPLQGANVVCVGASRIVGKPVAVLLMQAEATVVSTNIHTIDRASLTKQADIVVSAAGVPNLIQSQDIKEGAVVIDVGINRIDDDKGGSKTVGDVDFDSVCCVAGHISPVPGGVGPMTVAMLLRNTVQASESLAE